MSDTDGDPIREAIRTFDWAAVSSWLEDRAKSTSADDSFADLMERGNHSGHLILKRRSQKQVNARRTFLAEARSWAESNCSGDAGKELARTTAGIDLIERAYDQILEFLASSAAAELDQDVHTWALLRRLAVESNAMEKHLRESAFKEKLVFDPLSIHARDDAGEPYRPDSVLSSLVDILSSALTMFAHRNKGFDEKGRIVIPSPTEASDADVYKVGTTMIAGQAWRLLDYAQERWRFLGGEVSEETIQVKGRDELPAIGFSGDFGIELLDTVAHERLERIFAETSLNMQMAPKQSREDPTARDLPPLAYISAEEAHAAIVLCHLLHFDVCADTTLYAGLSLREWLRGYSHLALECRDWKLRNEQFTSWSHDELLASLERHGLNSSQAEVFLERVTFSSTSVDLFDAPLLLSRDGRYWCLADVVVVTNIPRAILSNISGCAVSIGRKGKALEQRVCEIFTEQGLDCRGFRATRDGQEYECDAAVVWEGVLFLFECKNRSLSGRRPSRLHRFIGENSEAIYQLKRLSVAIEQYPDILLSVFAETQHYSRIVLCVVNGLPFSVPGQIEGVFISDASAIKRFFEGGVNLQVPFKIPGGPTILWRKRLKELWAGEKCGPFDLVRYLESPFQVETLLSGYSVVSEPWPLSAEMAIVTPHVRMMERSLEQLCSAYGVETREFADELEALSAAVATARIKSTQTSTSDGPGDDD